MGKGTKVKTIKLKAGLIAAGLSLGLAGAAGAQEHSGFRPNVSDWVDRAEHIGSAPQSQTVPITVFLSFRNQEGLKALIEAQSSPSNPQYGQYLTPEQFRAQFAPPAADVARVQKALRNLGFTIESTPKSGLFVRARGTVAQVKAAFSVSQELYSYKGHTLRANAESPRLPRELSGLVTYVAGLDDTAALRKPSHIKLNDEATATRALARAAAAVGPNAPPPVAANLNSPVCSNYWGDHKAQLASKPAGYPQALPWLVCGYTPQQVRAAYRIDEVKQDGSGVRVAIVDVYASPTIQDDVNRYSHNHGLPKLSYLNFLQLVPPDLYNVPADDPCKPQGWYEEETLDVEAVHSMAPGAFILYGGIECTDPANAPLYDIIDNHLADIVTNSYSFNGENLPADFIAAENQFFMQAAAEGMSILFSSGDDGDLISVGNPVASGSWEATSPYVTAVGGTSLALLDKSGNKYEWGWGTFRAYLNNAHVSSNGRNIATTGVTLPFAFYSGSGGGPSLIEQEPRYQHDVPYSMSAFTTKADGTKVSLGSPHRVTPDISMVGDPYTGFVVGETYTIAGDPISDDGCVPLTSTTEYCEASIGGTSLSSPLFAGVLALVNQARFQQHKGAVGFVNPALYSFNTGDLDRDTAPIIKVKKPVNPVALLRGYKNDNTRVRVVTINSTQNDKSGVIEGVDSSYAAADGYDEITGLGTPNVPALIEAFRHF
jgi:subtilase family serine protease